MSPKEARRFTAILFMLTLVVALGFCAYPTDRISAEEIERHRIAAAMLQGDEPRDMLLQTRGPAQASFVQQQSVPQENITVVEVNWAKIAALCAVLAAVYGFMTKFILGPLVDKRMEIVVTSITGQIESLKKQFFQKPEFPEDYPLPRREFSFHKQEDTDLHRDLNNSLERFHERFRSNEAKIEDQGIKLRGVEIDVAFLKERLNKLEDAE